jgi:hypothetical protein
MLPTKGLQQIAEFTNKMKENVVEGRGVGGELLAARIPALINKTAWLRPRTF